MWDAQIFCDWTNCVLCMLVYLPMQHLTSLIHVNASEQAYLYAACMYMYLFMQHFPNEGDLSVEVHSAALPLTSTSLAAAIIAWRKADCQTVLGCSEPELAVAGGQEGHGPG
jgi:hypothetical protein